MAAEPEAPADSVRTGLAGRIAKITGIVVALTGLMTAADTLINQAIDRAPTTCKIWTAFPWCETPKMDCTASLESLANCARR
jgi:hypothetical protein